MSKLLDLGKGRAVKKVTASVPENYGISGHPDGKGDLPYPMSSTLARLAPAPEPDAVGLEFTLSGVSHEHPVYNGYPFNTLLNGQEVYLVPDPYGENTLKSKILIEGHVADTHPDPTALSVQDAPEGGRHIGYIPRAKAAVLTNYKKEYPGMVYAASISKIKGGSDGYNYGIDIVVLFQENAVAA